MSQSVTGGPAASGPAASISGSAVRSDSAAATVAPSHPAGYRICSVCVMDSTNPRIEFDANGQCQCCRDAQRRMPFEWFPNAEGESRMAALVARLKAEGRGRPYDAMVGLSGGIDSAYLAHFMRTHFGLRLLVVHVDAGWNSAPAVANIETLIRQLDLDLVTQVIEWQEVRDLQLAFLRASVLNQDIPQDHAFFATLYRTAEKYGIRSFLSGVNYSSECVTLPNWGYPAMDGKHVRGVHAQFGQRPLRAFPIMDFPEFLWRVRIAKRLTIHRPLNFFNYNKVTAKEELKSCYGWRDYGEKHSESRFTKFYQEIYLPQKAGFDKRRLHLSSLIVSGQVQRAEALHELEQPLISPNDARRDTRFVAKKLGISDAELAELMRTPLRSHLEYPNQFGLFRQLSGLRSMVREFLTFIRGRRMATS